MVKKAYFKNIKKMIFQSKARFISLFSIVFLGAAFFAGLRNSPTIMQASMNDYLKKYHFADLTYISSLGFSEDDIESLSSIKGVDQIEYGYRFDAQIMMDDKLSGVNVYASEAYCKESIQSPEIVEGRYPSSSHECLIDKKLADSGYKIGQSIKLINNQGEKEFSIVGIGNDVRYIAMTDRGTNTLGDGTNLGFIEILSKDNAYLALPQSLYDLRNEKTLYNQISIMVEGSQSYNIFSQEYDDYIENVNTKVKSQMSLRLSDLYENLTSDAQKIIDDGVKEYNNGLLSYNQSKDNFDAQILEAKIKLTEAKIQVSQNEQKLIEAQEKAGIEISGYLKSFKETTNELNKQLDELKKQYEVIKNDPSQIKNINVDQTISAIRNIVNHMDSINNQISKATGSVDGLEQLTLAKRQLEEGKLQIQNQENQLTLLELKTRNQLDEAKKQLDEAKAKLDESQEKVNQIPKGQLFTLTRHENAGIVNFESNVESIQSIASVFPLMFFLVSALVCLTTMTRMVEEQRGQNGTLRALGYSKKDIVMQYVIYILAATLIASLLGIVGGIQFFPRIIYYLYVFMLFKVGSSTIIVSSLGVSFATVFISVFVTLFVTLYVVMSELNSMPAVLMRPKSPKLGKRILLERIAYIWKRLSFNQKVTMRNIFRYKKRFCMSIIGIAGCTALIITGFGIKYSVSQVVDRQYKRVFQYDALIRLEDDTKTSDAKQYQKALLKRNEVTNIEYTLNQSVNLLKNKQNLYGTLVVYQSMDNIQNFISFKDMKNKKVTLDDEGVLISKKTAELLNCEIGDTFDIDLGDTKYNVKVSGIIENYFMHYVYMSQNLYETLTSSSMKVNSGYLNMKDLSKSSKKSLETYMNEKHYGHLSYIDSIGDDFDKQVESLNVITFILIACAGSLNFIVLYNLTNINIQERKSEIATIKVLGFKRKEVYDYVFRENIMLSIIGSLFGVVLGFLLHQFIIRTVELEMTMFVRSLNFTSYLIAVLMTIGFTMIINLSMRKVLNNVNMVESLKSVE